MIEKWMRGTTGNEVLTAYVGLVGEQTEVRVEYRHGNSTVPNMRGVAVQRWSGELQVDCGIKLSTGMLNTESIAAMNEFITIYYAMLLFWWKVQAKQDTNVAWMQVENVISQLGWKRIVKE